jgi:hypothetical protein
VGLDDGDDGVDAGDLFDEAERGPDDDLRLQFEATARLDDEGKALVKALLEAVLLRQEARRWAAAS